MVRVIRTFRPDVLVARFSGTDRDGHGHHQASAILTKEAFRAAADPKRFPEQIKEGLQPWQAKKLYVGNVCGFGATSCAAENYTVRLNTGEVNPQLQMSYIQFAMEGLRHQLSQGAGGWSVEAGDRFTYYKLLDSVVPPAAGKDGHEKNFFDGIDTSWQGLAPGFDAVIFAVAARAKAIAGSIEPHKIDIGKGIALTQNINNLDSRVSQVQSQLDKRVSADANEIMQPAPEPVADAVLGNAVAPRTVTFRWRRDDDPDPNDNSAGKLIGHAPDKD
jgi:hypothetical protein